MMRDIYFSNVYGDYVLDEMCKCGHSKSEHGSKITRINNSMVRNYKEGSCCDNSCKCKKFVFERPILLEEAAEIRKSLTV